MNTSLVPPLPRDIPAVLIQALVDPCTSTWLREAIISNALRDPVDARRDVAKLLEVMEAWLDVEIDLQVSDANRREYDLLLEIHDYPIPT